MSPHNECICGLAAAVTDLLQSVQLEYHGYRGKKNAEANGGNNVENRLNELFSLVQGLGGTAVVRTYIDQLAQVLSALVGWSRIEKCTGSDGGNGCGGTGGDDKPHGQNGGSDKCKYLNEVTPNKPCEQCKCMKWDVAAADGDNNGHHLGRGCTRCSEEAKKNGCQCKGNCYKYTYRSCYVNSEHFQKRNIAATWKAVEKNTTLAGTPSERHHHCAQTLLGSVCLIWSGITYMYWTGKYHKSSPRWNNHILDGRGVDDGTLSQWLQALGFPKDMLNDAGPGNRLDAVIWNGLSDMLLLGFAVPKGLFDSGVANDYNGNTARNPFAMNYAGLVHTIHRDSFNDSAIVFKNGSSQGNDQHKLGPLFKLYILSCAYFTGLQKKTSKSTNSTTTPRTIREILYWLSALPYSQAYPEILKHGKKRLAEVLKKPDGSGSTTSETQLKFIQTDRPAPITVDEFNLFAHFQAVTQYCPLVLIGIQGGIHSPKGTDNTKEPAIHSLYANTECSFTYPGVPIQAYNQVVHYIRALFYQLYFLRKQCAVKVTCGGKWRECRYGSGVLGKGVISWMCLGCNPMEHDRKCRVEKVKEELDGVKGGIDEAGENTEEGGIAEKVKDVLQKIGDVVVQLGNAQEALEGKAKKEAILGVKEKLSEANKKLEGAKQELESEVGTGAEAGEGNGNGKLGEAKKKLGELTKGGNGILGELEKKLGDALRDVTNVDPGKNNISAAIKGVRDALDALQKEVPEVDDSTNLNGHQNALLDAIKKLKDICNSPKCLPCHEHAKKCGQEGKPTMCKECGNMTTTGVPSPLQAFLEDRLPGFSCKEVVNDDKDKPEYPPAADHSQHCGGSGQCCPLPMGFRGQFYSGSISDMTGSRLYGILYFFSNENMMQSCVYTLVRVTAALSATTPQVLGDVFGFFRGGVGNKEEGKPQEGEEKPCGHKGDPSTDTDKSKYFCGWCASGLREEVKKIGWIPKKDGDGGHYMATVGEALRDIKGEKDSSATPTTSLSALTDSNHYVSPLTGELYTAVSATFGGTYLSWVLYLSDALEGGLKSLASAFQEIECRGCRDCDPNKCKKGAHGDNGDAQCRCQSIVSCTGVLPVLYRHGFSYGNPFNLEGYYQKDGKDKGDYSIEQKKDGEKHCHEFLSSINAVIDKNKQDQDNHPLSNLLSQVGQLQYDIRLPWIFVLTLAWLVAVLYLAFGAIWPLDWTHMRSHWLRGGAHQWQCMWYKLMTGRKGMELVEYFGRR